MTDQPKPLCDDPPHPLTFFLTARQRAEVLRALRAVHPDRAVALLRALGVDPPARRRDR